MAWHGLNNEKEVRQYMYNPYDTPESNSGSRGEKIHIEYKRNNIFRNRKSGTHTVNAGGAIIIIIFVVLCLTIFGILSFTTAFADKKLADRTLRGVQEYYAADTTAEKMLAAVYAEAYRRFGEPYADIERAIAEIEISGVELTDTTVFAAETEPGRIINVAYTTKMNDAQALSSEIVFFYNGAQLDYKITRWNIILTMEFDYDIQEMDVWDGSFGDFWE